MTFRLYWKHSRRQGVSTVSMATCTSSNYLSGNQGRPNVKEKQIKDHSWKCELHLKNCQHKDYSSEITSEEMKILIHVVGLIRQNLVSILRY